MSFHRSLHPFAFALTFWRHRRMISSLAGRRLREQVRGSVLGSAWWVLEPLAMLAVYAFVFTFVFRARWGALADPEGPFALYLFSGLMLYAVFSEPVNESPNAILSAETMVKQIVFPAEVLAWVSLLTALARFALGTIVLIGWYALTLGPPPATAWLVVGPVLAAAGIALGVTWFLSALGVYLRDLARIVGLATSALLFMSPVFYPASAIPERYRALYLTNPFARILEMSKQLLFEGVLPPAEDWLIVLSVAWLVAWAGHAWFQRTKAGFADVL